MYGGLSPKVLNLNNSSAAYILCLFDSTTSFFTDFTWLRDFFTTSATVIILGFFFSSGISPLKSNTEASLDGYNGSFETLSIYPLIYVGEISVIAAWLSSWT